MTQALTILGSSLRVHNHGAKAQQSSFSEGQWPRAGCPDLRAKAERVQPSLTGPQSSSAERPTHPFPRFLSFIQKYVSATTVVARNL